MTKAQVHDVIELKTIRHKYCLTARGGKD